MSVTTTKCKIDIVIDTIVQHRKEFEDLSYLEISKRLSEMLGMNISSSTTQRAYNALKGKKRKQLEKPKTDIITKFLKQNLDKYAGCKGKFIRDECLKHTSIHASVPFVLGIYKQLGGKVADTAIYANHRGSKYEVLYTETIKGVTSEHILKTSKWSAVDNILEKQRKRNKSSIFIHDIRKVENE